VLRDPALRLYRSDLEVVTPAPAPGDKGTGLFVLIRPDGHVAALGRPGSMDAVTGYLGDLFREPACHRDEHPEGSALHAACGTISDQRSS
jgi:hypothetical protein